MAGLCKQMYRQINRYTQMDGKQKEIIIIKIQNKHRFKQLRDPVTCAEASYKDAQVNINRDEFSSGRRRTKKHN